MLQAGLLTYGSVTLGPPSQRVMRQWHRTEGSPITVAGP